MRQARDRSGRRRYLLLGAAIAAIFLVAAPAQAAPFVYVANSFRPDNVSQYEVGAGGLLSSLVPATVDAGNTPIDVAVSPDGKSVYVANGGSNRISQYDVGPDGTLSPKSPATVAAGGGFGRSVAVSPDGQSVYVANFTAGTISQYDVGPGGALSPKSPPTVAAGQTPDGVAVSPDGQSVYVANFNSANVSQYDVGAGGALSPKSRPTVAAVFGPVALAVSPDGKSVYVADEDLRRRSQVISQYDVAPGGRLSPKSPPTVPSGIGPTDVAVSPDGRSVYTSNIGGDVSQYDVGAGGALSPKDPASVASGRDFNSAYGVAVSPDGESVYATNNTDDDVSQYDVGRDGTLTPKSPPTVAAGSGPYGIAVSPLAVPTSKSQCKHGGWKRFGFRNQGRCIRFVKQAPNR